MGLKKELTILGQTLKVVPLAEHVSPQYPDEDNLRKRIDENTVFVIVGGVKWKISARTSIMGADVIQVKMLSVGAPFGGKNFGVDLALEPKDVFYVDNIIIRSFEGDKVVQNAFIKFVDRLNLNFK